MKDSFVCRLPYRENDFLSDNMFVLNKADIEVLKRRARQKGQSLRVYITNILKKEIISER